MNRCKGAAFFKFKTIYSFKITVSRNEKYISHKSDSLLFYKINKQIASIETPTQQLAFIAFLQLKKNTIFI